MVAMSGIKYVLKGTLQAFYELLSSSIVHSLIFLWHQRATHGRQGSWELGVLVCCGASLTAECVPHAVVFRVPWVASAGQSFLYHLSAITTVALDR